MNWDSTPDPPARPRLARLRGDLDAVARQAREAAAAAVGRCVAGAVAEAVLAAFSPAGRHDQPPQRPFRPFPDRLATSRDGDGPAWQRDDDRPSWSDPYVPDGNADLGCGGESGPEDDPPRGEPHEGRLGLALAFGLQAAAWWLRRSGRASIPAALAIGALAALAGHALFTPNHVDDSTNL